MGTHHPPKLLAEKPCWLLWRRVFIDGQAKPRKVPYYVVGTPRAGTQGTDEDRGKLVDYSEACRVLQARREDYAGLGFALQPDAGIVALDFDDCVVNGRIARHVEELCNDTYTEFSPSGTGVRAFFQGTLMSRKDVDAKRGPFPVEVFGHNGFVTYTGDVTETSSLFGWHTGIAPLTMAVLKMYVERGWDAGDRPGQDGAGGLNALQPTLEITDAEVAEYLQRIPADLPYDEWIKVGMGVHQQTGGNGFELWHKWSTQGTTCGGEIECRRHWASFGRNTTSAPVTFRSVIKLADECAVRASLAAKAEWQSKIKDCGDEFILQKRICADITKDMRLDHLARETLAAAARKKFKDFGSQHSLEACRELVGVVQPRVRSHIAFEDDDGEASDLLNARILAGLLEDRFKYEHNGIGWRQWSNGAWLACSVGEQAEHTKTLGPSMLKQAAQAPFDPRKTPEATKQAMRAMSAPGIEAALKLARSDPRVRIAPQDFDRDPELLNAANGVVHLPSGDLRPHEPSQLFTRQCAAGYQPGAPCTRWMQFLRDVSKQDDEWTDYLWRACGYPLSGSVKQEVMFFLLGHGANGKSVFANVMRRVLHSYATSVPASFLSTSKRDGEAATPSLASLPGARLALANEVEAGSRLSAQTVKVACSTEAIAARHNYGNPFTFVPTHKLWVRGNHKPIVTDNDDGIWRRIVLIPFERNFMPEERDHMLEEKLMAEADGILTWMVRGYAEYMRRGLQPVGRVAAASAKYRKESDLIGQWLDERTVSAPDCDTVQTIAYANYREWCVQQGLHAVAKKTFTLALEERGWQGRQRGGQDRLRVYVGFRLHTEWWREQGSRDHTSIAESLF